MSVDPNYEFVEPLPTLNPAGNYALRGREISSGLPVTILLLPAHSRESIMGDINSLPPERRGAILKVGEWRGMMFVVSASRMEESATKHAPAEPLTPKVLSRAGVWKVPTSVNPTSGITPPQPPSPPPNAAPLPKPGEVSGFNALPADPPTPPASKDGPGEFTLMFQSPVRAQENAPPQTPSAVDRSPVLEEVTLTTEPSVLQHQPQPASRPFPSADVTVEASALHKPASPAPEPGEFTRMFQTSVRPGQQDTPVETPAPASASAEPGEFTQMFLKPRADAPVAKAPEPAPAPPPASRAPEANAPGEFTQLFPVSAPSPTAPAHEAPKLVIEGRDGARTLFPLDKPQLILGRSETVELSYPDDNRLSREHLKLTRIGDEWSVEDLRSKNGSFLNGRMLSEKTPFHRGDILTAGRVTISFQVPPSEVETVTFVPTPPPTANPPGEFTRMFQPATLVNSHVAVQAPLPPPPEPSAPPGGFTQLFQSLPPTPQTPSPPPAPPAASKPLSDNDATRLFDVKLKAVAAKPAPPPPSPPASEPGEFTRMFQAPARPSPAGSFPAASPSPAPPRPTMPPQPGEFTRIMESPMAPPAFRPGATAPPAFAPPPVPPKQQEGEFTRMFGVGNGGRPNTPPPPPPLASGGMGGATGAFSVPQQPSYSAPQGPSEFTRMFSVPEPQPLAAKPPAPAAPEAVVAKAAGPSPKLLIILLAVFAVLAVIIVVVFALRK